MSVCATDLLAPVLTAHGHLLLVPDSDAPSLPAALQQRLSDAFALGSGHGPLHLGAAEVGSILRPAWARWRDYAARYVTALCATPEGGTIAASDEQALDRLIADAPPMAGVEYLTTEVLRKRAACPHGRAAVSARVDSVPRSCPSSGPVDLQPRRIQCQHAGPHEQCSLRRDRVDARVGLYYLGPETERRVVLQIRAVPAYPQD